VQAAVFGPMPCSRRIGRGSSSRSTSPGSIAQRPSGFFRSDAIFASSLLNDTPTEAVRPVRSWIRALIAAAIAAGSPCSARLPPTSRKASSSDSPSTSGVNSWNTVNTWRDTSL
jgi:hypothetical protein